MALELAKRYRKDSRAYNYKEDYVAVNRDSSGNLSPVSNRLVLLAEFRAFEIQKIDYSDRFSVFRSMNSSINPSNNISEVDEEISKFYKKYDLVKNNIQKTLKLYFDSEFSNETRSVVYDSLPAKIKSYISLGEEKIRSVKFIPAYMDKLLEMSRNRENIDDLIDESRENELNKRIYAEYHVGDRVLKSDLKKKLKELYNGLRQSDKAKSTDIKEWFETKRVAITDHKTGKRIDGFELVSKKKL